MKLASLPPLSNWQRAFVGLAVCTFLACGGGGLLAQPLAAQRNAVSDNFNVALTETDATGQSGTTQQALTEAGTTVPSNIVLILTDDFSMNLIATSNNVLALSMPNLAQMMRDGMSFTHYFVTDSLCCPSRASIFTGMLPHNTGIYTNSPPDGGYEVFMSRGNDAKSFSVALRESGYQTAMMGKYLNGYKPKRNNAPKGWSEWAVSGNGYPNFSYDLNVNGSVIRPPLHMTDQISELGQAFIKRSVKGPFFLELSTFSPHGPYVPPKRYAKLFPNLAYPKTPAYLARPDANAPTWLKEIPPVSGTAQAKMAEDYRKRARSDKGIDDMIGAVRKQLAELGLANNTYVIFTSDNGYHMGEYSLRSGKQTPFDTDIRVPLVVVGPGVTPASSTDAITMNIDFAPTFRELAGLRPSATVDGQSFAATLRGKPGHQRTLAVVEHIHAGKRRDNPDEHTNKSGNPPSYMALRLKDAMYVEYEGGDISYYDLKTDPYELRNIADTLPPQRLKALHDATQANHTCVGTAACLAAQSLTP
jgi:N-acetylglucosamine-6-sulfatase